MQVSEAELRSMLAEAYERGWRGFLEGIEECVSDIVREFATRQQPDSYCSVTTTTTMETSLNSNIANPHYFYSSLTLPPPHNGGREDIV